MASRSLKGAFLNPLTGQASSIGALLDTGEMFLAETTDFRTGRAVYVAKLRDDPTRCWEISETAYRSRVGLPLQFGRTPNA